MKVLFINTNIAWGGGEKWHYEMALALKAKGIDVHVLVHENSEIEKKLSNSAIALTSLTNSNLSFLNPLKRSQAKKVLKQIHPDCIILNLPRDVKLFAPIAKSIGIQKVIYRRGMPHPLKATFLNRIIYKNIDTFIANSNEIKKSLISYFPEFKEKVKVVFNGVEPLPYSKKELNQKVVLGNLGRLVEQKGQSHFIGIAKSLKEKNFNFVINIAGTGPLKETLEAQIRENGLQNEIRLLGHMPSNEFFQQIDLFVFTSHFEGSANALIESLNHSIPAVTFDVSSNGEVIKNEFNGYLVRPFDEVSFAEHIIKLIESPDTYQLMSQNASLTIEEQFNYKKKVDQVIEIINE